MVSCFAKLCGPRATVEQAETAEDGEEGQSEEPETIEDEVARMNREMRGEEERKPKAKRSSKQKNGYSSVGRDEDHAVELQPQEAVDAATEEWAARIAASKAGCAQPVCCSTTLACGSGWGGARSGCGAGAVPSFAAGGGGAGAVPNFASPPAGGGCGAPGCGASAAGGGVGGAGGAAANEDAGFDGFDGFGGEEYDERSGWSRPTPPPQQTQQMQMQMQSAAPGGGASSFCSPMGSGGGAPPMGACAFSSDIDWSVLGGPSEEPGGGGGGGSGGDPFGGLGGGDSGLGSLGGGDDDEDDEGFTIFDGFGKDMRPTKTNGGGAAGGKAGGKAATAGLSWDDERKMWERKNGGGLFGSGGRWGGRGGGGGSPWDLRSTVLRSPASLASLRSQADRIFEGAVPTSLFAAPSMQRLQRRTDELVANVRSYFGGWFGR